MDYSFFVGIDVSKEKFDYCALWGGNRTLHGVCGNSPEGVGEMLSSLAGLPGFSIAAALFCMEHTGIYCNHLLSTLHARGAAIWLEAGHRVRQVNRYQRGKSDRLDAHVIALYAYKNRDEPVIWEPRAEASMELKHLSAKREQLIKARKQIGTALKETRRYIPEASQRAHEELMADALAGIGASLKAVERAIEDTIADDPELSRLMALLTSIEGVGRVTATYILVSTDGFRAFADPKKYACHSGVAPFPHESGKVVRSQKVSNMADKKAKALLHLCALSAVKVSSEMGAYYRRKVEEGKHVNSVLNAVKNKLIHRMFAVAKRGTPYVKIAA